MLHLTMLWKCAFAFLALGRLSDAGSIQEAFEEFLVVPDVVPKAPKCTIQVAYSSGVEADKGNKLTPTQVQDEPTVTYGAEPNKYYTLAMVDPDVPSRETPTLGEFLHWLVGNVPGDNVADGDTLAEYIGAAPPPGTGYHRYVFLAYEQQHYISFDEPRLNNTSQANRTMFSIYDFSEKYEFGCPVAGNFFLAQYGDNVDTLSRQSGGE